MNKLFYILLPVVLIILIGLIWRLISHRRELPCPSWLGWMVEMDNPFTKYNRAGVILELLDVQPGMKVLDAGCGPGRLTIPAARLVGDDGEVTAVDIQPEMLDKVQQKVESQGLNNVRFINTALGDGNLPQKYFDRALLVTVLGEIPDQQAALEEIFLSLKSGGILSINEVIFDPHYQSQDHVREVALNAGFTEMNCFGRKLAYAIHFQKSEKDIS